MQSLVLYATPTFTPLYIGLIIGTVHLHSLLAHLAAAAPRHSHRPICSNLRTLILKARLQYRLDLELLYTKYATWP